MFGFFSAIKRAAAALHAFAARIEEATARLDGPEDTGEPEQLDGPTGDSIIDEPANGRKRRAAVK